MSDARQKFESIARANGGTDFSLKQDGRYAVQKIQSRWTYFRLGWEAAIRREPLTDEQLFKLWLSVPAETEDRFAFARAIEAAHSIDATGGAA